MFDERAAELIAEVAKAIAEYNHSSTVASIANARRLNGECLRLLALKADPPNEDLLALLCAAFSNLLLCVPMAADRERLDQIIAVYAGSCDGRIKDALPGTRALLHALLGTAYLHRGDDREGDECDSDLAIHHLRRATELFAPNANSQLVGATHHNLGSMYTSAHNYTDAVRHCEIAAKMFSREMDPLRWAIIQSDLGLAHIAGDREEVEVGMSHLLRSLEVFDRTESPRFWAHAHKRLGITFQFRVKGDRSGNLEASITHYRNALSVFTGDEWQAERQDTLTRLGEIYYKRLEDDRLSNLSRAIEYLEEAGTLGSLSETSDADANLHFYLARSYLQRGKLTGPDDLAEAVARYQSAIKLFGADSTRAAAQIAQRELAEAQRLEKVARCPWES